MRMVWPKALLLSKPVWPGPVNPADASSGARLWGRSGRLPPLLQTPQGLLGPRQSLRGDDGGGWLQVGVCCCAHTYIEVYMHAWQLATATPIYKCSSSFR